jgi:hypothetical protein
VTEPVHFEVKARGEDDALLSAWTTCPKCGRRCAVATFYNQRLPEEWREQYETRLRESMEGQLRRKVARCHHAKKGAE